MLAPTRAPSAAFRPFRRFHGAMPRMPATVRAHLASVDGRGHIAVSAFIDGELSAWIDDDAA